LEFGRVDGFGALCSGDYSGVGWLSRFLLFTSQLDLI
jgi:hypothetical protein